MYRILTSCRACTGPIRRVLTLGHTPLANSLSATRGEAMSLPRFPLNLCTCETCGFVQLDIAIDSAVLFEHYVYVTPDAASLRAHYDAEIEMIISSYGPEANAARSVFSKPAARESVRRSLLTDRTLARLAEIASGKAEAAAEPEAEASETKEEEQQ